MCFCFQKVLILVWPLEFELMKRYMRLIQNIFLAIHDLE